MADFKKKAGVFANIVAGSTKKAALFAARKTKNTAHIAKLNMNISSKRDVIKRAYSEIGKLYYETHKGEPEGFFVQLCQEIDLALEDIAAMESEIVRLKTESATDAEPEADMETVVSAAEAEADPDIEVEVFVETEPETPEPPEIPEVPAAPEEPEPAVAPEEPAVAPEAPEAPAAPEEPETPETPEVTEPTETADV